MLRRIDHIYLAVTDFTRSEAFYDRVMEALGQHKGNRAIAGKPHAHYLGPQFQLSRRPARSPQTHDPYAAGLHHLCFQVDDAAAVDECFARLQAIGIEAAKTSLYPEYHPDYCATFFSDPDGIRLEIVGQTPAGQQIEDRWQEFDTFVNPLASLQARSDDQAGSSR
jgi:catechol 2,3-dioxygenase-like lactoylglutathione lyase family enzyme